jgi:hypothetical protein
MGSEPLEMVRISSRSDKVFIMTNKLSDHEPTHEVMDALKEVLNAYSDPYHPHNITYCMEESDAGRRHREIVIRIRVPVR